MDSQLQAANISRQENRKMQLQRRRVRVLVLALPLLTLSLLFAGRSLLFGDATAGVHSEASSSVSLPESHMASGSASAGSEPEARDMLGTASIIPEANTPVTDAPQLLSTMLWKEPEADDTPVISKSLPKDPDYDSLLLLANPQGEANSDDIPGIPEEFPGGYSPLGDDWRLLLVNPWNYLPPGYEATLTQLQNGHAVDERCYPDLQRMMDDCRAEGLQPLICSSYRSQETQEYIFSGEVNNLIALGYTADAAHREVATYIAVPGSSEHQLGLAVDIVDLSNQNLDESQESTPTQLWLMQNSWRYGFILRYPSDKFASTGIIYEPWHYRYVGQEAAKEIYQQGICLEEYLAG